MLLSRECKPKCYKEFQSVSVATNFDSYTENRTTQKIKLILFMY